MHYALKRGLRQLIHKCPVAPAAYPESYVTRNNIAIDEERW